MPRVPIQMPQLGESIAEATIVRLDIALGDERMQAGLAKRDISNLDAIFCAPRTGGNFGAPHEQAKRVVKARSKRSKLGSRSSRWRRIWKK